jgi:hypothetical protein
MEPLNEPLVSSDVFEDDDDMDVMVKLMEDVHQVLLALVVPRVRQVVDPTVWRELCIVERRLTTYLEDFNEELEDLK